MSSRSVSDIIPKLLEIIPSQEIDLINSLNQFNDTLWNKAPEILKSHICWIPLQDILNLYLKEIDNEWKEKLVKIFNNID
jgi:hypothetical protein